MTEKFTLGDLIGENLEEDFKKFDLTEVREVLAGLEIEAIDLAHAEQLQQQSLRCANLLSDYLSKMIKTTTYLESKVNTVKNRVALEYTIEGVTKIPMEMRKLAGDSSPEVEKLNEQLAVAKGSKSALEKKYDILLKAHHHFKEITVGLRRSVLGYNSGEKVKVAPGWE